METRVAIAESQDGNFDMRLTQISITGYRALANVSVRLRPLTVLIGPNGAGKTSFLKTLDFVRDISARRLFRETISDHGGIQSIRTRTSNALMPLAFELIAHSSEQEDTQAVVYKFQFGADGFDAQIISEECSWQRQNTSTHVSRLGADDLFVDERGHIAGFPNRDNLLVPQLPYSGQRTVDVTLLKTFFKALESTTLYGVLDTRPNAPIRRPQTLVPSNNPGQNGETLFSFLYNLKESSDKQHYKDRIEEVMRLAFPGFIKFEFYPVGGGQITLRWQQKELSEPLYPQELSEGSLRFLWLTSILLNPNPPALLLLDEPEVSLHPELIQLLASLLQDASARTQIIVATQSSDLLRWLEPDNLVVADKKDGIVELKAGTDLDLDRWLQDFTLSELWHMGVVGGRT